MNKIAKPTSNGQGVLADHQILTNRLSARARKGWDTRRSITKQAEDNRILAEARTIVNSISEHPNSLRLATASYLKRKLINKVRNIMHRRRAL